MIVCSLEDVQSVLGDSIGRRNRYSWTKSNKIFTVSEISFSSALSAEPLLYNLRWSTQKLHKHAVARVMKLTASLSAVTSNHGAYTTRAD